MAQPKIQFYKSTTAPAASTHGIGTLWFDKTNRVLKVRIGVAGTDADWEQYAGKIDDIQLANGILTIKKADGTTYTIDLTDIASAGAVKDALDALDAKITANDTAIKANTAAITKEAQDRAEADNTLQTNIDTVDGRVTAEASRAAGEEARIEAKVDAVDTAYKAADTAMNTRISTLEDQITGLSGTLHFRADLSGAGKPEPTASTKGEVGDFMVAGNGSEYICVKVDGSTYTWEKIGDTSAEVGRIAALETRMDTAEDEIDSLLESVSTNKGKISALEQGFEGLEDRFYTETEVDSKVANLQGQISSNDEDITALQTRAGEIEAAATVLTSRVNTNENTIKTKAAQTDLDAAVARISANEGKITALQTSTSNNAQAIAKEADDRAAADEDLQDNIDAVDGKVATEKQRAEAAEAGLAARITTCENALTWSGFED